jgi:nitroimidazol reductase NimA-like FMN-containing flavoprotein (pyridoxamine 5'-phosphate oxidase superfamily)
VSYQQINEENMTIKDTPLNKMRHPEYARDDDWIVEFLRHAQIGHIATRSEEQPYITPTLFWYDPQVHEIYFHSNVTGRVRSNAEGYPQVCFEASQAGKLLPSNIALEFSIQYESVIAFGTIRLLEDEAEKKRALYGLIEKYFPTMTPGEHYRPITEKELKRTSVYAIAIHNWSGKRNWKERAHQGDDWPSLGEEWFR